MKYWNEVGNMYRLDYTVRPSACYYRMQLSNRPLSNNIYQWCKTFENSRLSLT